MRHILVALTAFSALWPTAGRSTVVGYSITITTAYATGDPFANRLDNAFTEGDTGYLQIANTGDTTFSGVAGTIAVSAFAGDLSFTTNMLLLPPGASVSIAIPDDASDVGGFNGPAYFARPGVEITLGGTMSDGSGYEPVNLMVADSDIHSGLTRTDSYGLTSDSFVLQGGDPWGFDTGDPYELGQADGVYIFAEAVPEPSSLTGLAAALVLSAAQRRRSVKHLTPIASPGRGRRK